MTSRIAGWRLGLKDSPLSSSAASCGSRARRSLGSSRWTVAAVTAVSGWSMERLDRVADVGSKVTLSAPCRDLRRQVGMLAWAVLEDVALDAVQGGDGVIAATSARRVAAHLGVTPGTAANALRKLLQHELLSHVRLEGQEVLGGDGGPTDSGRLGRMKREPVKALPGTAGQGPEGRGAAVLGGQGLGGARLRRYPRVASGVVG